MPTGKLSICTAKTNADTRPAMGAAAVDSASSTRARLSETPTTAAAATPVAMEVVTSRKPSGTCTGMLLVVLVRVAQGVGPAGRRSRQMVTSQRPGRNAKLRQCRS